MPKFNPGDRVKYIQSDDEVFPYGLIGEVLEEAWPDAIRFLSDDGEYRFIGSVTEFELIDEHDDPVKMPSHYRQVPGIECKDVVAHFNFFVGSAIKYLWRHEHKGDPIQNLEKAIENIQFEIDRRKKETND